MRGFGRGREARDSVGGFLWVLAGRVPLGAAWLGLACELGRERAMRFGGRAVRCDG